MNQYVSIYRWGRDRGLSTSASYEYGANVFKDSVKWMQDAGVKYYTVYAFSCENWQRAENEVAGLMNIFEAFLKDVIKV